MIAIEMRVTGIDASGIIDSEPVYPVADPQLIFDKPFETFLPRWPLKVGDVFTVITED